MRRVVISHSQLPKRPQVSLFHTQTNQKLNGKLGMLSHAPRLSLLSPSHPALVTAELRNPSPGTPGHTAFAPLSPPQAEAPPGVGSKPTAVQDSQELPGTVKARSICQGWGWYQFGGCALVHNPLRSYTEYNIPVHPVTLGKNPGACGINGPGLFSPPRSWEVPPFKAAPVEQVGTWLPRPRHCRTSIRIPQGWPAAATLVPVLRGASPALQVTAT